MSTTRTKTFEYGDHTVVTAVTYRFTDSDDPTVPVGNEPVHKVVQTVDATEQDPLYMTTAKLKDYLAGDNARWTAYFDALTEPELDAFLGELGFS